MFGDVVCHGQSSRMPWPHSYNRPMAKPTKPAKEPRPTIALKPPRPLRLRTRATLRGGMALTGWEVKSIRAGLAQLSDSYVLSARRRGPGSSAPRISPLVSASTHVLADPTRTRKLLLHASEISRIFVAVQTRGQACVCNGTVLEGRPREVRDRLGQGQEGPRQACQHPRARLEARARAFGEAGALGLSGF